MADASAAPKGGNVSMVAAFGFFGMLALIFFGIGFQEFFHSILIGLTDYRQIKGEFLQLVFMGILLSFVFSGGKSGGDGH